MKKIKIGLANQANYLRLIFLLFPVCSGFFFTIKSVNHVWFEASWWSYGVGAWLGGLYFYLFAKFIAYIRQYQTKNDDEEFIANQNHQDERLTFVDFLVFGVLFGLFGLMFGKGILWGVAHYSQGKTDTATILWIDDREKCSLGKNIDGYLWKVELKEHGWKLSQCSKWATPFVENDKLGKLPYSFQVIVHDNLFGEVVAISDEDEEILHSFKKK